MAREYNVYPLIKFHTKVMGSYWDPSRSQWRVDTIDLLTGGKTTNHYHFVITAIGHFNEWKLPSYPGISDYRGFLCHSSAWDPSFDPNGKRIATIGNGASGIQVTTSLQKVASHIDHYARNRKHPPFFFPPRQRVFIIIMAHRKQKTTATWIAGSFNAKLPDRKDTPMLFTPSQHESFRNPSTYLQYRKELEATFFRGFEGQLKDSETSRNATRKFREAMKKRLGGDEELLAKLEPPFPPNCRRLTPGPGYLEALMASNLTLIQTPIERCVVCVLYGRQYGLP